MPGLVEAAEGGTLILNEVEAIPVDLQAKILDLADARAIRSLGSTEIRRVDVRLIATTNADLRGMMNRREFRQDLYYRLAMVRLTLPPLRKRRSDIPRLAQMVLEADWQQEMGQRPLPHLDAGALAALQGHHWPGNIRELKAVLFRAAMASHVDTISDHHVEAAILDAAPADTSPLDIPPAVRGRYRGPADPAEERQRIVEALRIERGHRKKAARRLSMSRQALWEKMRVYNIGAEEVGS
jgi:DNA-binding NtrC family response regulator